MFKNNKHIVLTGPIGVGKTTTLEKIKNLNLEHIGEYVDELDLNDNNIKEMILHTYNKSLNLKIDDVLLQMNTFSNRFLKFCTAIKNSESNNKYSIFDRGPLDPMVFNELVLNKNINTNKQFKNLCKNLILKNKNYFKNVIHIIFDFNTASETDIIINRIKNRNRNGENITKSLITIVESFNAIIESLLNEFKLKYVKINFLKIDDFLGELESEERNN